ncbi:MAG: glutamate--tRNA ligase [Candidatus Doudnabacteria bacterium]|nr:glutamate--tRNA ligase [Candidatus Doudnabacteria bacterium]
MTELTPSIRTRFAPSPTGYVHIGSLRTALFSFLFARHNGGTHILRIEDTDQNRLVPGAVENLVSVLHRLGVEFDEGYYFDPQSGEVREQGACGPYLQSERLAIYERHAQILLTTGKAYYCFCSTERLDELRKEQTALKKPPMYDRHCRNLSSDERERLQAEFAAAGKRPVIRQTVPETGQTVIHDLVYGDITHDHRTLDDHILVKSDGFPTYHFAVVVDDHEMQITHVIRGEEWIPSTPKHLLLYAAFGWEPTQFAHLPLILNPDKSKLSKRQGDVAVEDFLNKGYLPEALLNFVAFLGWNPKTEQEIFSLEQLIADFDVAKINKASPVLDTQKLDWTNAQYIREKSSAQLAALLFPYWEQAGYTAKGEEGNVILPKLPGATVSMAYLEQIATVEKERLKKLSDIPERTSYFFDEPTLNAEQLVWKKSTKEQTIEILKDLNDWFIQVDNESLQDPQKLQAGLFELIAKKDSDVGSVMWPLRVALTGLAASPGPAEVATILASAFGSQKIRERLSKALKTLQA